MGTPTYIPQNDPHDALIIWNIHKWGKNCFQKKILLPSAVHLEERLTVSQSVS